MVLPCVVASQVLKKALIVNKTEVRHTTCSASTVEFSNQQTFMWIPSRGIPLIRTPKPEPIRCASRHVEVIKTCATVTCLWLKVPAPSKFDGPRFH